MTRRTKPRRGRKPLDLTPEERAERQRASRAKNRATTRNVTLDADILALLDKAEDALEVRFGFRPTHSQTIRHLIASTAKSE